MSLIFSALIPSVSVQGLFGSTGKTGGAHYKGSESVCRGFWGNACGNSDSMLSSITVSSDTAPLVNSVWEIILYAKENDL